MPHADPPPQHVRAAFGVVRADPEPAPGGAWQCGDVVLRPVDDPERAAWLARSLDRLQPDRVRLARALRSSDGRWVVSGWTAAWQLGGRPEPRHDEVVAVSVRLHAATESLTRPPFLGPGVQPSSLSGHAAAAAWGERELSLPDGGGGHWFTELGPARKPIDLPAQLVHGDLFGNVLFAGSDTPGVVGFVPHWRPPQWAAGIAVVDALAWGGADPGLLTRWSSLPDWPQVLLRALLFRIAVHAMHPESDEQSLAGLQRAVTLVSAML